MPFWGVRRTWLPVSAFLRQLAHDRGTPIESHTGPYGSGTAIRATCLKGGGTHIAVILGGGCRRDHRKTGAK